MGGLASTVTANRPQQTDRRCTIPDRCTPIPGPSPFREKAEGRGGGRALSSLPPSEGEGSGMGGLHPRPPANRQQQTNRRCTNPDRCTPIPGPSPLREKGEGRGGGRALSSLPPFEGEGLGMGGLHPRPPANRPQQTDRRCTIPDRCTPIPGPSPLREKGEEEGS